jgi:hypothetical protein
MGNKLWHIMFGLMLLLVGLTNACAMQEPKQN